MPGAVVGDVHLHHRHRCGSPPAVASSFGGELQRGDPDVPSPPSASNALVSRFVNS